MKTIIIALGSLVVGLMLGLGLAIYLFKSGQEVILIHQWAEGYTREAGSEKIRATIGNGLYDAIKRCADDGGYTSLESAYRSYLTCHSRGTTNYFVDWKWKAYYSF